jgi:hypothetical protein
MLFSRDTSPEAARVLIEQLRRLTPARRLAMVAGLNAAVRMLAMAGLRRRFSEASSEELEDHYSRLVLDPALAEKVIAARRARRNVTAPTPPADAARPG